MKNALNVSNIVSLEIKETNSQYFIVEVKGSDGDEYLIEVPLNKQMPVLNSNINAFKVYVYFNGVDYKQHDLKNESNYLSNSLILILVIILSVGFVCFRFVVFDYCFF